MFAKGVAASPFDAAYLSADARTCDLHGDRGIGPHFASANTKDNTMVAIFGGGMLILGVVPLAFALCLINRQKAFLTRARFARGNVIKTVRRAGENGWLYRPVIEFKTEAGRAVTFADCLETSWIRYRLGVMVPVVYEPSQPNEARIHSFASLWLPSLITGILGLLFISAGAVLGALFILQQWA